MAIGWVSWYQLGVEPELGPCDRDSRPDVLDLAPRRSRSERAPSDWVNWHQHINKCVGSAEWYGMGNTWHNLHFTVSGVSSSCSARAIQKKECQIQDLEFGLTE